MPSDPAATIDESTMISVIQPRCPLLFAGQVGRVEAEVLAGLGALLQHRLGA